MNKSELHKRLIEIAALSPCKKRKVGAIIVEVLTDDQGYEFYNEVTSGFNFNPTGGPCEIQHIGTSESVTHEDVTHAEIAVLEAFALLKPHPTDNQLKMFITHPPCVNCASWLQHENIPYEVMGEFMKFDGNKLRYDLIPTSATLALAKVLTYGARKYKPNNWRKTDDPGRYVAAAMRHFEAYRAGEMYDEESGLHHLDHVLTNIAFLVELDFDPSKST